MSNSVSPSTRFTCHALVGGVVGRHCDICTFCLFASVINVSHRLKYSDDITYASTSKDEIYLTKGTVHVQLHAYNLIYIHVNEHNTEEYTVPDATPIRGKDSWHKCKLLGSLLDTKEGIHRRKMITISTMKENSHAYNSKYRSDRISKDTPL